MTKSSGSSALLKRRWKGQTTTVLALVFFSLLVPLAFLLGVHNRFPSGNSNDDQSPTERSLGNFEREEIDSEADEDASVDHLGYSKSVDNSNKKEPNVNLSSEIDKDDFDVQSAIRQGSSTVELQDESSNETKQISTAYPTPIHDSGYVDRKSNSFNSSTVDDAKKSCELEFGSYCLWSIEHKEMMRDSVVKRLKDQLFVARAYYPSIAKTQGKEQFSRELKENIQEHERMLSEAISDADLPPLVIDKIQKMDETIRRAKLCTVDCNNVDKKLRQLLDLTEDEAYFHMKQSAFLYHLGVQTIPKSHHCLSMRLTVEYFKSHSLESDLDNPKFHSPNFMHFVIFSKNILAASVVINSTIMSSEDTENMIFHLITDVENYYAMKYWFMRNSYNEAIIQVLNFDEIYNTNNPNNLGSLLTLSEEFRVSIYSSEQQSSAHMRTEYISVFGHSHFLLPDIFYNLKKVVVLDDDVVVKQDLSALWNLDLKGKVIGAVQHCGVRLGQLKHYLGNSDFDAQSCAWMSGLNVIDLENWREYNVTGSYDQISHEVALGKTCVTLTEIGHVDSSGSGHGNKKGKLEFQSVDEVSWRAEALPASQLAFKNLIYPLDNSMIMSGLGHNYQADSSNLYDDAAVLHYNGNMKPWMELGIPKYKQYWKRFLAHNERFMDECNVNA